MDLSYIKPNIFTTLKNYKGEQFVKDIISGIIVAIIAMPLSIALAIASGVNPEQGLYTAVIAGFFISFLGGSSVQIGGPTAAFVIIIYGIVAEYGVAGLTVATIMAGLMLIAMGALRLGDFIKFIPKTITVGFTFGIAVSIVAGQIKDFFGLQMTSVPAEFIEKLLALGKNFHTFSLPTVMVGALALLIQIFWHKVSKKIPGSLIAIIVTTAIVKFGNLEVKTIGDLYTIKAGLPGFTLPQVTPDLISQMISPAFTIAILAAIESLLSCVVSDGMTGSHHNPNAELVGQGVGNIMSALFGGIPATGAIARTAANVKNGGRTPVAGMIHALTLLLILVFLMPYASLIPMSCLAAILIMVGYNMSGWKTVVHIIKTAPKSDIAVLLITLFLTVLFDLVLAIKFGMILAAFLFLKRMSDIATIRQWVDKSEADGERGELKSVPSNALVYEIFGALFFGAVSDLFEIAHEEGKNVLILRMRNVPAMDISGLEALEEVLEFCKKRGMILILSHVNEQPMKVMEKSGFIEKLGKENLCESIDKSLERAESLKK
mgnify:FL=1